ncbi:MAG: sugar transporter, ATP-binding component [Frankiales bacterium]|nr:sugar transporter, ATP-binding component [Frankiales bacterium]
MADREAVALELHGVSKHFGGVPALSDVDLVVRRGEVHGLLGQNGSGKSTLIKILGGYHAPDTGRLSVFGEELPLPVRDMQQHGIAIIHQDLGLVGSMTVTENVGISDGYRTRSFGRVDWRAARRDTVEALARFDSHVDPERPVGELHPADQAIVAIVRAIRQLDRDTSDQVFVLDEPTAYLGPAEAERVIAVMRHVAATGSSVIFVSHKLSEVLDVTDRCTILRDGRVVDTVTTSESSARELVRLQLGRDLDDFYPAIAPPPAPAVRLRTRALQAQGLGPVDLELHQGEILGVTGLAGMGQDELIHTLGGSRPRTDGEVEAGDGKPVGDTVREALADHVVLVPADRKEEGLWLQASSRENMSHPTVARGRALRVIDRKAERSSALAAMQRVAVRPLAPELPSGALSGGNQQKVLIAKWLGEQPEVLLLHEPTQGVDAAARREILGLVTEAAEAGTSVVVCSTDYEQLANLCHRVLVLRDGLVVSELAQPFSEDDVMLACQAHSAS